MSTLNTTAQQSVSTRLYHKVQGSTVHLKAVQYKAVQYRWQYIPAARQVPQGVVGKAVGQGHTGPGREPGGAGPARPRAVDVRQQGRREHAARIEAQVLGRGQACDVFVFSSVCAMVGRGVAREAVASGRQAEQ